MFSMPKNRMKLKSVNSEKDESDQNYDIFDSEKAIDHFDTRTLLDACKYASKGRPRCDMTNPRSYEQRASIQKGYDEASSHTEIEHGSEFYRS